LDFISQSLIVNALRQGQVQTILLAASDSYMNPSFYNEVPSLFRVVGVLLVREKALRSLYNGRSNDLWEMAESIASHGCDSIIIFREEQGLLIYEKNHSGRWILPSYPSLAADPTGVYDSFAGGFFHGYQKAYRPEEGALYGSTSASLTIEGSGPLYPLGVLSGLAEARLESLRQALRKI
jgi:sugar/nucleoside kinase (ribokinase family)